MHLSAVKTVTGATSGAAASAPSPTTKSAGSAPLPLNQSGSSIAQFLQQGVQAIGAVLQIRNQQQLAEENLRRVRQGLQPIDIGDVPGLVPTAEARVCIDESTQRTLLLVAALGIGAYLFTQSQKR